MINTVYHSLVVVTFIRLVKDKKGRGGKGGLKERGALEFSPLEWEGGLFVTSDKRTNDPQCCGNLIESFYSRD